MNSIILDTNNISEKLKTLNISFKDNNGEYKSLELILQELSSRLNDNYKLKEKYMELIGIDKARDGDCTSLTLINRSEGKVIYNGDNKCGVRGLRSKLLLFVDKSYDKYLKRVSNRNKLYNKLKKLGRRL